MGLTLGVTFICFFFRCLRYGSEKLRTSRYFPALLVAVNDSAAGQVVRAQFYDHAVLREDSDVVLTHLPRDVGKYSVSVGQLNAKHCVGQSFDHCAFDLDDTVFFGHCLFVAISDYWSCVFAPNGTCSDRWSGYRESGTDGGPHAKSRRNTPKIK